MYNSIKLLLEYENGGCNCLSNICWLVQSNIDVGYGN